VAAATRRITVRPGLQIAHDVHGPEGAPWLTLITGYGGLQEGWFRQVPYFAQHYQVLTLDNRGAGRSDVLDVPTTMRDLAQDVVLLLDALRIEKTHVWGVSMGGKVAMELALGWPDRVDRLVLENTTAGEAHRVEGPSPTLPGMQPTTEEDWLEGVVPLLFSRAYREANAASMIAFARSRVRNPADPAGMARQWEAYLEFDAWDRLGKIVHPTLVLAGDEDALTDARNSQALVDRIPHARFASVPGGHSVHIENPTAVNEAVAAFLAS
jgi:3-oxoadipate enol-lactonase